MTTKPEHKPDIDAKDLCGLLNAQKEAAHRYLCVSKA
jgi:hypothetical protein